MVMIGPSPARPHPHHQKLLWPLMVRGEGEAPPPVLDCARFAVALGEDHGVRLVGGREVVAHLGQPLGDPVPAEHPPQILVGILEGLHEWVLTHLLSCVDGRDSH